MTAENASAGRTLFLVGMPGAGKSRVGRALAARLGWRLIDADTEIEREAGRSIARIFSDEGEERFRQIETDVIRRLPETQAVVALGGGALVREENRTLLEAKGVLVWLDASIDTLVERTSRVGVRPLLAGLDPAARATRLRALEAERRPQFARAKCRVDTDDRSPDAVAGAILTELGMAGRSG